MKHAEKKSLFRSTMFKTTFIFVLIAVAVASLLVNLFTFVMPVVQYYGNSMNPTLEDGQILVVNKLSDIENGDIQSAKDRLDLARIGMTSPLNYATPEMIDAKRDEIRGL